MESALPKKTYEFDATEAEGLKPANDNEEGAGRPHANDNSAEEVLLYANDNDVDGSLSHANDNEVEPLAIPLTETEPQTQPQSQPPQSQPKPAVAASSTQTPPPGGTKEKEFSFGSDKIVFVETADAVDTFARDAADERMTANKEDLQGFSGFVKKIWKHNLFHEYYRQKELAQSKSEIEETGNLYAAEGKDKEAHQVAMNAIVNRFASEYEEVIHTDAGETRDDIDDGQETSELNIAIRELVGKYATGEIDDVVFKIERDRVASKVLGLSEEQIKQQVSHADNMLEIAQNAKAAYEHGWSLDMINSRINIVAGRAKVGVRTEAGFSTVDRISEKIIKSPVGKFLNETTVSAGVALAYTATVGLSERLAKSQLLSWGTMGATTIFGGLIAGARENIRLKEERRQHARDRAKGKEYAKGAERRAEMEELIYDTVPASFLMETLAHLPHQYESEERYREALATLAETEARISLSDQNNLDLIGFSGVESVEIERLQLDIARAEAKITLRQIYEEAGTRGRKSFDELYKEALVTKKHEMYSGDEGIEARDRMFNKMKRAQVAKTAVKATATGLLIGATAQEAYAALSDTKVGVFEGVFGSSQSSEANATTAMEGLRGWLFNDVDPQQFRDVHGEVLPNNAGISLPDGGEFLQNGDNPDSYTFILDGEEVSNSITFENGRLTEDSVLALQAEGVVVDTQDSSFAVAGETRDYSAGEFAERSDSFHTIERDFWYDNDTVAPLFDKNELGLHWGGGEGGEGIDENGNFVFSVSTMTPDGSYHDDLSVDAQERFKTGNLTLLLSLSEDSQSRVVEVPIDSNGNAVIDPESEIGKTFFRQEDGKLTFVGRFAEVAQEVGRNETGDSQYAILATHEGSGVDTVASDQGMSMIAQPFTMIGAREPDLPIDAFMPIPLLGRKPLEPSEAKRFSAYTAGYYGYNAGAYGSVEQTSSYKERASEKILANKNLDLSRDDLGIVSEYLDKQEPQRKQSLEDLIADAPPMSENIKAVITIPAYREGKNLEKTLRNYAKLKNREQFELVILENHPQSIERDDSPEVIARMQQEFPDMNIVHLYKRYENKPKIGEVRKDLVDSVLLRKKQAGIERSIAIASNDADLEDINENYLVHIIHEFETHPKTDAVSAKLDYPQKDFEKFPLMHASLRLLDYFAIAFRHYYAKSPELRGANTAYRSGSYAAVGGYNEASQLGEDLEIGWMIKEARGYEADRIKYLNPAWIKTNSRRPMYNLMRGGDVINQYQDFHENEQVREEDVDKALEKGVPFDEDDFSRQANAIYKHYYGVKKSQGGWCEDVYVDKSFKRAMRFLGVSYKVVAPGEIKILNTDKLKKGLGKKAP